MRITGHRRRCRKRGVLLINFLFAALCIVAASSLRAEPANDEGQVHWIETDGAQVKLDGKVPIKWNLYQPDKKDQKKNPGLTLVLLGHRYLLLDTKTRLVYEVHKGDLQAQGSGFTSDGLAAKSHSIPSDNWNIRDVGPADLINVTLEDYGSVLEVQLPHPLILTPPVHYY